ncbi:MAG: ECF transporter S component [Lachnospiraceae bacterium]|nr:ECF transporter S component [Lachnospiraceae bacterium]MBD5455454.1 ECF transporter S component [Lachnospiraceae bacterium]
MKNEKTYELVLTALFTAIIIIMAFTPLGYIPLVVINATIIHIPVILGALFLGPKKGAFLGFAFGFTSFLNNTFKAVTPSAFVFSPVLAVNVVGISGIFKSLYICFVPRILVGVIPYFVYLGLSRLLKNGKKVWRNVVNLAAALILFVSFSALLNRLLQDKMAESTCRAVSLTAGIAAGVILFAVLTLAVRKKASTNIALAYAGLAGAFTNTLLVMSGIFVLYKNAYAQALGIAGEAVFDTIAGIISFNGVVEAVVAAIITAGVGIALLKVKPIKATGKE